MADDIKELLKKAPQIEDEPETIILIGAIRNSKKDGFFEFALDNTGDWVSIPLSQIESVEEAGALKINNVSYHVAQVVVKQTKEDDCWFELLRFVLKRAETLWSKNNPPCECESTRVNKAKGGGSGPKKEGRKRTTTTTAHCVSCWIFTMGSAERFCYTFGHCD